MVLGKVYEFTVDGKGHYNFNRPVTLTFTFDPADLAPGETPVVHYYDEETGQWVSLGGTVSGNTIMVSVDHFTKYAVLAVKEEALSPARQTAVSLSDITGHWAEVNIKSLVASGAIIGYPDGTFRPDNTITRAEFATVLVKAFNLEAKSGKVFADTANHWAKDAISTAAAHGIISGYDQNTFGSDDPVTREQMAVMVVKAAKLTPGGQFYCTDGVSIAFWAKDSVGAVIGKGIMKGYPDSTFRPREKATRAEAVTVLMIAALSKN